MLLVVALGLASAGCVSQAQQLHPTLRVGIVNLDRVLPELPEYRQYSDQYVQERARLFKDAGTDPKQVEKYLKDKQAEVQQSIQKWDETRRKFLDQVSEQVRVAANQVARDKQIDIVLVNAPWFPVSQRMAVDITTDVIYALRDNGKSVH
jgi:Skp family chaperone for outer membrane proteins